jgi:hypothetical protein
MRIKTIHPHISALHMVRRCDEATGREEKILVLETDVNLPRAGKPCDDESLYTVLQQLETLKEDVENTYGKFQMIEIRTANDNNHAHF